MPEVNENCEFLVCCDQAKFSTQTNGDVLLIRRINLNADQAASLAWLINQIGQLKVEIKKESV